MTLPYFNYCSTVLFLLNQIGSNKMQKKQNHSLRIILGCDRDKSIKWMLEAFKLLRVRETIFIKIVSPIYKITHELVPKHFMEQISSVEDKHMQYNIEG